MPAAGFTVASREPIKGPKWMSSEMDASIFIHLLSEICSCSLIHLKMDSTLVEGSLIHLKMDSSRSKMLTHPSSPCSGAVSRF